MSTWKIAKQFDFCYGHRVHNQSLNVEYSLDSCLACRHLHGHQGTIHIFLEAMDGGIASTGMVTDFKHLNWMKKWIDDVLDHKFIIDRNDPVIHQLFPLVAKGNGVLEGVKENADGYFVPELTKLTELPQALYEVYEGLVIVNFVPTSENLCAWIAEVAQKRMAKLNVKVCRVNFFETPKSQCVFES